MVRKCLVPICRSFQFVLIDHLTLTSFVVAASSNRFHGGPIAIIRPCVCSLPHQLFLIELSSILVCSITITYSSSSSTSMLWLHLPRLFVRASLLPIDWHRKSSMESIPFNWLEWSALRTYTLHTVFHPFHLQHWYTMCPSDSGSLSPPFFLNITRLMIHQSYEMDKKISSTNNRELWLKWSHR